MVAVLRGIARFQNTYLFIRHVALVLGLEGFFSSCLAFFLEGDDLSLQLRLDPIS